MTSKETTETPNKKSEDKNSEPITQVQRDSVITREDLPAKPFRIGVTLVTLGALLLFFAFYFGIINV
ncbi:hypothetical protein H6F77_22240 [Microcoleus sp. FACHB-831]|uniref:hypothetical protein n=1 Tax=Microcoleus sp. FACHB-831 TaxID=2692827 RepID=UPI001681E272|nr:hypothetical protein [Microcoleus sp. FACHB-831]MBD1923764.1 hypothetical protein [Microcoleus sp. FACHB-831]